MRRIFTILILFFCSLHLTAQSQRFGNEWINFSQSYYKIKVADDGVYRIDYSTLNAAGLPLGSINVHNIQLYANGSEQFIYIHGDADNSFDAGDYIEFFGKRNLGELDSQIYHKPWEQPHQYYSLFTDTTTYYLTWTTSSPGKRYSPFFSNNYSGFAAEVYFMHEEVTVYTDIYSDGAPIAQFAQFSEYTEGEGWIGSLLTLNSQQNKTINSRSLYSSGPTPKLEFKILGKSNAESTDTQYNHHIQIWGSSTGLLYDLKQEGYFTVKETIDLPASNIGSVTSNLTIKSINDLGAVTDVSSVSYFRLIYPRSFDMQGLSALRFKFSGMQSAGLGLLQFTNFPVGKTAPYLYDLSTGKRIRGTNTGGTASFLAPDQGSLRDMYLWDSSDVKLVTKVEPVQFRQFDPQNQSFQYVIITNDKLMPGAVQFGAYKNQQGFDTVVVSMSQLYEQFAYGQQGHPVSIRHFADFLLENASPANKLEYVLLLGKGQSNDRTRKNTSNQSLNLVPAWGVPASDLLFGGGLGNTIYESPFAIGRIPCLTNEQINTYLNKLKDHDNLLPDVERKNILHIAAGRSVGENESFKSNLEHYSKIAEDSLFGAKVTTYSSSDNISNSDLKTAIVSRLNEKTLIMNYFGHGAANTIEVDIGQETEINPVPMFYFGGCLLGNTFADISLAERYLFSPGKGVITWFAGSNYGFVSNTTEYTIIFYQHLFRLDYGAPVGKVIMNTIADYQDTTNVYNRLMSHDMQYFGDPAMFLYSPSKPDFFVRQNGVSVPEPNVSTDNDSFHLAIIVRNAGRASNKDSVQIRVSRTFAAGSNTVTYPLMTVPNIRNTDTIFYVIKGEGELSKGINEFTITLDPDNKVDELSPNGESNNTAYFTLFLNSSGISIIRPEYNSIVPTTNVTLLAESGNLFIKTNYLFELDTVPEFNSPFKKASAPVSSNHLVKWQTTLLNTDSTVYYWRVRYASDSGSWESSVFTYIQGSPPGWASFNFQQSSKSNFNELIIDTAKQSFSFKKDAPILYRVNTAGSALSYDRKIRYVNASTRFGLYGNGIIVMAFDPIRGKRYIYPSTNHLSANNSADPYYSTGYSGNFYFNTTTQVGRDSLVNHLNRVPDGYNILVHNGPLTGIDSWDSSVYQALYQFGAARINDVREGHPYILFGSKGMQKGQANEMLPDTINFTTPAKEQILNGSFFIYPLATNGSYFTEKIGPSRQWKYFYAKTTGFDNPKDKIDASVYGYDTLGNEVQIFSGVAADTLDLSSIDAAKYPYLRIRYLLYDDSLRTPARVSKTAVLFEGLPEGTLNPDLAFAFEKDTLNQGDSLKIRMGFQNIGQQNMDSVLVEITVRKDGTEVFYESMKYGGLKPDSSFIISRSIPTLTMSGKLQFELAVNNGYPLKEQSLANNFYNRDFYVKGDITNPLLDVTADGQHIMDNDIISPNPVIRISVSDDNTFFILDDTTAVDLFIRMPGSGDFKRISYKDPALIFQPATSSANKAYLEYRPVNWPSGTYEMKVSAQDKAGNKSGNTDYHVRFRIIRESSISNLYPYPNPFTTQCRFVFTLTGERLPDQMRIQIMTVTGKVVKEIDMKADGGLRLGNNISTFVWDGTDQYGDRLANGVYLYTVTARIDGKDIKLMETAGDVSFNHGYGKIYLMK